MIHILKASETDYKLITKIAQITFIESHGNSAPREKLNKYIAEHYNEIQIKNELLNQSNIYHIIYYNEKAIGFSNIILNSKNTVISEQASTKMDRIYLLKEFYGLKLGKELLDLNIKLSKKKNQKGMWLYVWTENYRAISFYKNVGFKIVGKHNFKIDETHSNSNHVMFLKY